MKTLSTFSLALVLPAVATAQQQDPQAAWADFTAKNGTDWQVVWNPATGTPKAIFGPGLKLAGPVQSLDAARTEATRLLDTYAAVLGRGDSRFVEIIGEKTNMVYTLVYDQEYKGLPVISGRADVRINEIGVVALFGSSAVQIPQGFSILPKLGADAARTVAEELVLGAASQVADHAAPRLVVWADAEGKTPTTATLAWEVQVDERPAAVKVGKAYIDALTGALLQFKNEVYTCNMCTSVHVAASAGKSRLAKAMEHRNELAAAVAPKAQPGMPKFAYVGKVQAWLIAGHNPNDPLVLTPLKHVLVTSTAGNAYTDDLGNFTIASSSTASIVVSATLTGQYTKRIRVAQGTQMSVSATFAPNTSNTLTFGTSSSPDFDKSQTTVYYFVDDLHNWFRSLLPASAALTNLANMDPRVNIASTCNAYYTGYTINFYAAGGSCNHTAYETVVQHEWGHGADDAYGGISQVDGLSEGWGDILCTLRSRQPLVGPNFYTSGASVRTALNTLTYPAGGGVHQQGQTWMGFSWDLRTNLMTTLGAAAGEARCINIVIKSIVADATNQADAVREVFIQDDDDGNLNNGTPNYLDLEKAALKRKLPYPIRTNPNAGSYTVFGKGCPGSGKTSASCATSNSAGGTLLSTQNTNIFALGVPASTSQSIVTGFEIYTQATGSPVTINTQLYLASGVAPTGSPVATGTMTIGSTAGWYKTTFASPVTIPANQKFFISYTSVTSMMFPFVSSGTLSEHYWHPPTGTTWNGPFSTQRWAWKVNCQGGNGGAIPILTNVGVPEIGSSFQVNLSDAKVSTGGLLLVGASDKVWGSLPLPLNLAVVNAPLCTLYCSGEILVGINTSSTGTYVQNFSIPNNAALFGAVFFNQYALTDSANGFGVVFSNAGAGKVGKP